MIGRSPPRAIRSELWPGRGRRALHRDRRGTGLIPAGERLEPTTAPPGRCRGAEIESRAFGSGRDDKATPSEPRSPSYGPDFSSRWGRDGTSLSVSPAHWRRIASSRLLCPQPTCSGYGTLYWASWMSRSTPAAKVVPRRQRGSAETCERRAGLVVGQVGEDRLGAADPVADRGSRMTDQRRGDGGLPTRTSPRHFVKHEPAAQVAQPDRKERRREIAPQALAELSVGRRSPDGSPSPGSAGKKPSPWMWSMCRCVSRMSRRRTFAESSAASRRMPVPASRINTVPRGPSTSTHAVLPP